MGGWSGAQVTDWQQENRRHLLAALVEVRTALGRLLPPGTGSPSAELPLTLAAGLASPGLASPGLASSGLASPGLAGPGLASPGLASPELANPGSRAPILAAETNPKQPRSALELLSVNFDLSPFERWVLLLTAAVELEASFADLCARARTDAQRPYPTFSLALAAFPEAEWRSLSPDAPLRYWRLIEVGAGPSLTDSPLRIDERILHYLVGVEHRDARLAGLIEPLASSDELLPSHDEIARRLAATWTQTVGSRDFPVLQLAGDEIAGKRAIAGQICAYLDLNLQRLPAECLPQLPGELDELLRLWQREAILTHSVLFLDCDELETADLAREAAIQRFLESITGGLILSSRQRRQPRQRPILTVEDTKPTPLVQRAVWRALSQDAGLTLNGEVEALVAQFNLSLPTIHAAWAGARGRLAQEHRQQVSEAELGMALWETCRQQARPRLDHLADRIEPGADWNALVLPESQGRILHEICAQLRHRGRVYETWGFASQGARGLGISALFAGSSGTGKTLAAEVLARDLHLDLYRIDLSSVVSKYIGETEKNLKKVFDAAEEGGAILLFDEADALFGKRSEVKDSHDRHANIEVSYLLQRMESYRGLAILTTNLKDALDQAFLRRLRFIVEFPFPSAAQRAEIWRRVFPAKTPTLNLDAEKLAQLNVAGGNIRNIGMNAAFLAAAEDQPVQMRHILVAARREYAKLEKMLPETEVRGWI